MTDRPIIFSVPMVRALLDGRKTQTRRILSPGNTLFDGRGWPRNRFATCFWHKAWVDNGPSPMGNPGPYLKVEWPYLSITDEDDDDDDDDDETLVARVYPRIQPGDRLWVRGAHYLTDDGDKECVVYAEDQDAVDAHLAGVRTMQRQHNLTDAWAKPHLWLRPAIHMPRWASRLTLTVTDVRVQRLQDISEADAVAEGCLMDPEPDEYGGHMPAEIAHERGGYVGWDSARDWYADLWESLHGPDAWAASPWCIALTFSVHTGNIAGDQIIAAVSALLGDGT